MRKAEVAPPVAVRSAGGVVIKGSGGELRVAVMRSGYGTWVFPKGRIEQDESPQQAARRELGEEIGLREAELLGELGETEHGYEEQGERYRKRVNWFLYRAGPRAELSPNPDENALDCGWFTPEQALSLLSHGSQRRVLRRGLSLLRSEACRRMQLS